MSMHIRRFRFAAFLAFAGTAMAKPPKDGCPFKTAAPCAMGPMRTGASTPRRSWRDCRLASSSLSPKTIRGHVDNLWLLGGEIIRDLHEDPPLRKLSADRLLRKAVYEDGGPLIHNSSEHEQRSFGSTCRKLHRFLTQPERTTHHKFL